MKKLGLFLLVMLILLPGCGKEQQDPRIKVQEGVASDTLGSNIITKPVMHAFSALVGDRISVTNAAMRRNISDILELQIEFYNKSYNTERFEYRVEWYDEDGFKVISNTDGWTKKSVAGKSNGTIIAIAPNPSAVDFKMNTRNQE